MKKLIAGNWKMNGNKALVEDILPKLEAAYDGRYDMLVCPPFTLITLAAKLASNVWVGGQDCHYEKSGAHTGDTSPSLLLDAGASWVILGHSERRHNHGEQSIEIKAAALSAIEDGLKVIICVGETEEEKEAGKTLDVVAEQLEASMPPDAKAENVVIAYEPVWAIGTGKVATAEDIKQVHAFIREQLIPLIDDNKKVRILYGGSVKPSNASEILNLPNVDGALVGGASLKAEDFLGIAQAV